MLRLLKPVVVAGVVLTSGLVAGALPARGSTRLPATMFAYHSSSRSEPVADGTHFTFTKRNSNFQFGHREPNSAELDVQQKNLAHYGFVILYPPRRNERLHVGTYRVTPKGHSGHMDIAVNSAECDSTHAYGKFTIKQIHYTSEGVNRIDATFTLHCNSPNTPALYGHLRFDAR
jgi:hypothetical protein